MIVRGVVSTSAPLFKKYYSLIKNTNMKIVTPIEMEGGLSKLDEALLKFKGEFAKEEKGEDYYHIVIIGEYNRKVLDEVEILYKDAGWEVISCRTSSENGERPGLTGLQLKRK